MFLIPLLASALAIPPKRSTSSLGVFLSIVILVTQHKINQYAEDLGARGTVDPVTALWVPFLVFAGLAVWMYYTVAHVPGGQPIGALERVAAKAAQRSKALFRIFQRKPKPAWCTSSISFRRAPWRSMSGACSWCAASRSISRWSSSSRRSTCWARELGRASCRERVCQYV